MNNVLIRLIMISSLFFLNGCNELNKLSKVYEVESDKKAEISAFFKTIDNIEVAKEFIENNNFDINQPDKNGHSLLIAAVITDNYALADTLLQLGANPNWVYPKLRGKSSMGWAAQFKNDSFLKLLIKYGGDVDLYNLLLDGGANPNVVTLSERTPLLFAASTASWKMTMQLLNAGANFNYTSSRGIGVIPSIERNGGGTQGENGQWRRKVVEFLESNGMELNLRVPLESE
ncbi:ankyrin repeat domain-containing protein [Moritella viscosa]